MQLKLQIHMCLYYFSPVLFAASEPGLAFSGDPAFSPVFKTSSKTNSGNSYSFYSTEKVKERIFCNNWDVSDRKSQICFICLASIELHVFCLSYESHLIFNFFLTMWRGCCTELRPLWSLSILIMAYNCKIIGAVSH